MSAERLKDGVPEPEAKTEHTDPTVGLTMQIDRAMKAFLVPGGHPVDELQKLDQLYGEAGEAAKGLVDTTARRLFQQTAIFDNLNFHSSLLSNGSAFFGAVLRRMGELVDADEKLAEGAKLPVLIRLVEHCRRGGNNEKMDAFAQRVETELAERIDANDTLALGQLAKVRYEQSMGRYGKKDYEGAIRIGEESIALCDRAGDQYGVLAARGNTAGLFRYEWARSLGAEHSDFERLLAEGRPVLEADLLAAQEHIGETESGSPDRRNHERVEMNNAYHLMHIADLQNDRELGARMMAVLWQSPVFTAAFNPQYPRDPAHAQAWVHPFFEIAKRLQLPTE